MKDFKGEELLEITDEHGDVMYIRVSDTRTATIQDALDNDWSLDDIYGSSVDSEWLDEYGELINKEELESDLGDCIAVSYWDGSNNRTEILNPDTISINKIDAEVKHDTESDPSPLCYYCYNLDLENGKTIAVTKSNMSGSLSPYFEK